jgi:hypothetical protein
MTLKALIDNKLEFGTWAILVTLFVTLCHVQGGFKEDAKFLPPEGKVEYKFPYSSPKSREQGKKDLEKYKKGKMPDFMLK